jgi:CheY-like chemotaxis protein
MNSQPNTRRLILWIDDDQELLRQQRAFIQEKGYDVRMLADVDEAIKMIQDKGEEITGVIIDVMMSPGATLRKRNHNGGLMTGIVLIEYLKENDLITTKAPPPPRCFIFTHRRDVSSARKARNLGFKYFHKHDYKGSNVMKLVDQEFGRAGAQQ